MAPTEREILRLMSDYAGDQSWTNRQLGAQLAAQQKLRSAEIQLGKLLKDPVDWVRFHAFKALTEIYGPHRSLIPVASRLLSDRFFRLRNFATEYLRECAASLTAQPESSLPSESSFAVTDARNFSAESLSGGSTRSPR